MLTLAPFFVGFALMAPAAHTCDEREIEIERVVNDRRFDELVGAGSRVEALACGFGWAEGPVWAADLDALLFSDVQADKIYRWDEASGVSLYLQPSGHAPDAAGSAWRGANGLAIDADGALLLAQQSSRKLARMSAPLAEPAPRFEVLAGDFDGRSLNSPNDLVVHRSGDVYFTDPPYGLAGFEKSADIELDFFGVFRLAANGDLSVVSRDLDRPNGIALSTDHSTLYVSSSDEDTPQIVAFDLDDPDHPGAFRLLLGGSGIPADGPGSTDGMAVHVTDALFVSLPAGLGVVSADGELLGRLVLGQVTNMTFDPTHTNLYITTPSRVLRLRLDAKP